MRVTREFLKGRIESQRHESMGDILQTLYAKHKLSISKVAILLRVSRKTIRHWMKEEHIQAHPSGWRKNLTSENFRLRILNKTGDSIEKWIKKTRGTAASSLARKLGISEWSVYKYRKLYEEKLNVSH